MIDTRTAPRLAALALLGATLGGCSPTDEASARSTGREGSGGEVGSGGSGASTGRAGGASAGGSFGTLLPDDPGSGGVASADVCNSVSVKAETIEVPVEVEVEVPTVVNVPTTLFIMLDRSQSMNGARWTAAVSAINAFVADPDSQDLKVALQYFPLEGADYGLSALFPGPACTSGQPHDQPMVVADLTAQAPLVSDSLATIGLMLGTPIEAALRGMTLWCVAEQQRDPSRKCVGVFITDGEPFNCTADHAILTGIVAAAQQGAGMTTFAVGMDGADFALLDAVALAGASDCDPSVAGAQACNVSQSQQAFLDALTLIRQSVGTETRVETHLETQSQPLECEWLIPSPPEGEELDPGKVNVRFAGDGVAEQSLGAVPSEAECASYQGGWYYDDAASPTRVRVCPQTCDLFQGVTGASVDIVLGCKTEPAELR